MGMNDKKQRKSWLKRLSLIAVVFAMLLVTAISSPLQAQEQSNRPTPRMIANEVTTYLVLDKLLEGRDAAAEDAFTFRIEAASELAKEYEYVTCKPAFTHMYPDTFGKTEDLDQVTIRPATEKADRMEAMLQSNNLMAGDQDIEEFQEILRALFSSFDDEMETLFSPKGFWDALVIEIKPTFYEVDGVKHNYIPDGDYTFHIYEESSAAADLLDSQAIWELNIHVENIEDLLLIPEYTLTRIQDDNGIPDGSTYEMGTIEWAYGLFDVATVTFTNEAAAGSVQMQPADVTIYMGGSEGYTGVVNNEDHGTIESANSLPEAGYYLTLPKNVDERLKQIWKDSADMTEITNADGSKEYVLNLSDYVTIKDRSDGREWTLQMYGSGYSMAYNKYVYRLVPKHAQQPIRLQFSDKKGNTLTEDEFVIADALYEEYQMSVYEGSVKEGNVVAEIEMGEGKVIELPLELEPGTLRVRYVSGTQGESVSKVVTDITEIAKDKERLQQAAAVVKEGTVFYINDSRIPVDTGAQPSLLFDDVVSQSDGVENDYAKILSEAAQREIGKAYENVRYEAKYLDLVDAHNGNMWLKASEKVTVYWPYPKGTDENTEFALVHFEGLNREMLTEEIEERIELTQAEIISVEQDAHGISFETDSFSPFVLIWEERETTQEEEEAKPEEKEEVKEEEETKPEEEEKEIETAAISDAPIYAGMLAMSVIAVLIVLVEKERRALKEEKRRSAR